MTDEERKARHLAYAINSVDTLREHLLNLHHDGYAELPPTLLSRWDAFLYEIRDHIDVVRRPWTTPEERQSLAEFVWARETAHKPPKDGNR